MKIHSPSSASIEQAARAIKNGHLIAVPTETVYGLAANALNDQAVAKIYEVKNRPQINPLIIHVTSIDQAKQYGIFCEVAEKLAKAFWPGPLTMVLPKSEQANISLLATAGLNTIAIRFPAHPVMTQLIEASGYPLAAPSANPSGQISPTTAEIVLGGFNGKSEPKMILDGGFCKIGLESTIVDLTTEKPCLLRQGGLPLESLLAVTDVAPKPLSNEIKAPGSLSRHYSPKHSLRLNASHVSPQETLLAYGPATLPGAQKTLNLSEAGDLTEAAANFFRMLHQLDKVASHGIAVMEIPDHGLGQAINERLRRACLQDAV